MDNDEFVIKHAIFKETIEELGMAERGGVKRLSELLDLSISQIEKMKNIKRKCMPDTTLNYLLLLNEVRTSNPKLYQKASLPGGLLAAIIKQKGDSNES